MMKYLDKILLLPTLALLFATKEFCECQNTIINALTNIINNQQQEHNLTTKVQSSGQIPIHLNLNPPCQEHGGELYVLTGVNLNASADIDNPHYRNLSLEYHWSTKDGPMPGNPNHNKVTYAFANPEENSFMMVSVTHYGGANSTNLTGSSWINFTVSDPVVILDPEGKLFLEHGELLQVKLKFKGSPPYKYCHKFCYDYEFVPCDLCFPYYETTATEISIIKYLHYVGNYTLMLDVQNLVSRQMKHYTIKINDTVREQSLPFAPIVSSILVVLILLSGLALHLHFKETAFTETANFDFIRQGQEEEEWEEEQTFIQRVKYILCRGDSDDEEIEERQHLISNIKVQDHQPIMNNHR